MLGGAECVDGLQRCWAAFYLVRIDMTTYLSHYLQRLLASTYLEAQGFIHMRVTTMMTYLHLMERPGRLLHVPIDAHR